MARAQEAEVLVADARRTRAEARNAATDARKGRGFCQGEKDNGQTNGHGKDVKTKGRRIRGHPGHLWRDCRDGYSKGRKLGFA